MRLRTINESLETDIRRKVMQLADKIRKSFEKSDKKNFGYGAELAEIHAKLADFYREYTDDKYKLDQGYSKTAKESVARHYDAIKKLLPKLDYDKSPAYAEELEDYVDAQIKNYREISVDEPRA